MSTIQLLSRSNYQEQHLVTVETPLPELAASSIRVKTSIISLTVNTLTYARLGHLLSIWSIYPLPSGIPVEFSDHTKFGRIGSWGYATVIESTVSEIEVGTQVFGLIPIGTLPQDMQVQVNAEVPGQFFEVSKHREKVMSLYNQYLFRQAVPGQKESQGQDALFQVFFLTSYLMNRFALPWNSQELVNLWPGNDKKISIDDKTVVIIFADSGKTALALAYLLKSRPAGSKPCKIVGVGSKFSRGFVEKTGFYDKLLTYDSDSADLSVALDLKPDSKVLICEFGSRGGAGARWAGQLQTNYDVAQLVAAGEVIKESPEEATERFLARAKTGANGFNASVAREAAIKAIGEKRFLNEFLQEWELFRSRGLVPGIDIVWGNRIEDFGIEWEHLSRGQVKANQGLIFAL